MNKNRIEKNIHVTISVDIEGKVRFDFYEPESGDLSRICGDMADSSELEYRVGAELTAWATIAADELDEMG